MIRHVAAVVFAFSLAANLFLGWSPNMSEATVITGIKRHPSFLVRVQYPKPPATITMDRDVWYNDVALPRMYRSHTFHRLENDSFTANILTILSRLWIAIAGIVLLWIALPRIRGAR